jgi:hypothetical protein
MILEQADPCHSATTAMPIRPLELPYEGGADVMESFPSERRVAAQFQSRSLYRWSISVFAIRSTHG